MPSLLNNAQEESFIDRAFAALRQTEPDAETRSLLSRDGAYALFTDSRDAGKGVEFLLGYPQEGASLDLECALFVDGRPIFDGKWETRASVAGVDLKPIGEWETECEDIADAYAFSERTIALSGRRRFSRRVLLAYRESILLVADELRPNAKERKRPEARELTTRFHLANDALVERESSTRETTIAGLEKSVETPTAKKEKDRKVKSEEEEILAKIAESPAPSQARRQIFARLFPLELPEARDDASRGDLVELESERALELATRSSTATLFAPLIFDFNARRAERSCDWRSLTVGENLAPASRDSARGYKLRLGKEQYVVYASTSARPVIRSVLSRHLLADFMFGKFLVASGVNPLVEVEALED